MLQKFIAIRKSLNERKVDAVLVSSPVNSFYLTGFEKPNGDFRALQVLIAKERIFLLTNTLYAESVKVYAKRFSSRITPEFRRGPATVIFPKSLGETLARICRREKISQLGFEADDLKFSEYRKLEEALKGVKPAPVDDIFRTLRMIKSRTEISRIRKAAAITDTVFKKIIQEIRVGMTEKEVAREIDFLLIKNGADEPAFETIVAAGANSAQPHHKSSNRKIRRGDVLLLDFGARLKGYCSDFTRTVFVGQPNERQAEIYARVLEAQKTALENIRSGMKGAAADALSRNFFKKNKLDKYFIHSLGHNLGLSIHEPPSLSPTEETQLTDGMVFSVEPGLYLPGKFGVRIEDTVLLQNGRPQSLTRSPRNLITV